MKPYDAVEVWGNSAVRSAKRFKMVVGRWNRQGRKCGREGDVSQFAVTAAAIEFHTDAKRAWREALNRFGRVLDSQSIKGE